MRGIRPVVMYNPSLRERLGSHIKEVAMVKAVMTSVGVIEALVRLVSQPVVRSEKVDASSAVSVLFLFLGSGIACLFYAVRCLSCGRGGGADLLQM